MTRKAKAPKTAGRQQTARRGVGKSAELATPPDHAGRFKPGQSGNPVGRPKGLQNHATREMKTWAQAFLRSKAYRRSLMRRVLSGDAGTQELRLAEYAFGKPATVVEVTTNPFRDLSDAELDAEIAKLDREAEVIH